MQVINLIDLLTPGFVSLAVFYLLTSYVKPQRFEGVIYVVIFTVINKSCVLFVEKVLVFFNVEGMGNVMSSPEFGLFVGKLLLPVFIGFVSSQLANEDRLFQILRRFRVTRKTSFPTVLHSYFAVTAKSYYIIYLKNGVCLSGYVQEFTDNIKDDDFVIITDPQYLSEGANKEVFARGHLLIRLSDIAAIEQIL